jgi:hypothetical protein
MLMKKHKAKTKKKRTSGRTTQPAVPAPQPPQPADPRDGEVAPGTDATAEFKAGKDI